MACVLFFADVKIAVIIAAVEFHGFDCVTYSQLAGRRIDRREKF